MLFFHAKATKFTFNYSSKIEIIDKQREGLGKVCGEGKNGLPNYDVFPLLLPNDFPSLL